MLATRRSPRLLPFPAMARPPSRPSSAPRMPPWACLSLRRRRGCPALRWTPKTRRRKKGAGAWLRRTEDVARFGRPHPAALRRSLRHVVESSMQAERAGRILERITDGIGSLCAVRFAP